METLMLPFSPRYIVLTICAVVTALLIGIGIIDQTQGVGNPADPDRDLRRPHCSAFAISLQKNHAVLRNYPIRRISVSCSKRSGRRCGSISSRARRTACRFPRHPRVVYQRAKMQLDKRPFGTQEDVYSEGYEWMHHSVAPKAHSGARIPRHHRRPGLHQAVFGLGVQHLGDEFRRAQPQRHAGAEYRGQEGRLRP